MKKYYLLSVLLLLFQLAAMAQWDTACHSGNDMVVSFVHYNNSIYATGFFTNICGASSKYIARWDGSQWYAVDTGLSDAGHRVEVLDDTLYVAQYRQTVDSNWVLKWDGAHFQKVGAGVYCTNPNVGSSKTANIYDVAMYNGHLVASGEFDNVGGQHISGIMQWNGTGWGSLGSGLAGSLDNTGIMYPHQLLVYGPDLYVVGNFTTAGGITVNGVARWDGVQWHDMNGGLDKEVYAIGVINGQLYVGGEFTNANGTALRRIARWDGTQWIDPGFGVYYANATLHPYVHTIQQVGSHGIFEGGFDHVVMGNDTFMAHSVIAYDGTTVDTMDGGFVNGEFEGLTDNDSSVLIGGAIFDGTVTSATMVAQYQFHNVGVKNIVATASNIMVYPNPAHDQLYITNAQPGSAFTLYDLVGRQVYSGSIQSGNAAIPISGLKAGVYLLALQSSQGAVEHQQIVKQ